MRTLFFFTSIVILTLIASPAPAQDDFRARQKKLKAEIERAYKSKKLTANEYRKLMDEQAVITRTIELAEVDGHLTPDEKNKIHAKLTKAGKRLVKYRHNNEIY